MNFEGDSNEDFSSYITGELAGTKTEKNLQDAYSGESKARNNYTYFAKQARKDGYEHIAKIFEETANNEKEHGKIWFKLLNGGKVSDTLKNLETASGAESYEWEEMYAKFAQEAKEEGFNKIAYLFETIRSIEKMHMTRYNKLIQELKNNTVFKKETNVLWECSKCGYRFDGKEAPKLCPFCKNPQKEFFVANT